jgi:PAS domain S-box-containing protein
LATDGQVLGTFALYYTEPRCPNEADLESISASVYLASIALERTQVEEEQRESERRLELALRGADLGLWDVNLQTGADKVDKRAAEMLGYSLTEVETHLDWWDKRTHPDDLSRVQQAWDAHVQGKTPLYECEYRLRTKLDDWKWILDRGKVVEWDSNGQPLRLAGTHQDITKRKETEESLHQALQRTQLLYNISEALATLINQQAAFETVLGEYLLLLNVDRGGIMILDPAGEYNRVQALYIDNKVVESNLVFPAQDDLVARHLVDYPFAMVVADVSTHPLTSHNHHIRGSVEAMLLVPIIVRGHTVGILGADATQKGHVFTQDEMELGEAIADQLAIWLENHRLLAEAEYRFELLQTAADVSRAASSMLDVNELINTLVNLIRDKFDYYYVGLFLIDEAKEWAVLRAGTGEAGRVQLEKRHQLKIGGESMIGWCIQNRQARIALDVGKEAVRFQNPDLPDTHSEMALPLLSRGEVIGALTVQSTQRGAFSKEDITVLQTMADHLANGLENARLFEKTVLVQQETKKLLQEQTALREAASAISSTLDLQAVLTQLAVQMGQAIDATSVYIGSYDQVTQTSTVLAEYVGPQAGAPEHVSDLGQTYDIRTYLPSLGEFLRKGYHSYHFDDAGLDQPGQDYLQQFGVQSELHVPLRIRGQLIAIATVWESRYRREFTADEISLCQGIAQQAAIAIENARLHTETQQRLKDTQALQGFSHKLAGTLQLDQILATFFETCASVLGFDYALFCLVDKYQHRVKVVDGFGVSESHKKRANYGLDSHDIMADIVKTGKTEVITGWDDRFDKALFETEGHSNWLRIFTPITLRQEHIGLVEAGFNKNIKNKITDPQIRLLRAFIDQTALAIDNAQRYQASQKAAKREALIKEITTKVRASTNLDTILQITAKEVGDALGSKRTYVHVISSSNGDTSKKMKRELP